MCRTGSEKLSTPYPSTSPKPCTPYFLNQVPRTFETMYHVSQARNYVPSMLDTMYFHQKFDKQVEQPQ